MILLITLNGFYLPSCSLASRGIFLFVLPTRNNYLSKINYTYFSLPQFRSSSVPPFRSLNLILWTAYKPHNRAHLSMYAEGGSSPCPITHTLTLLQVLTRGRCWVYPRGLLVSFRWSNEYLLVLSLIQRGIGRCHKIPCHLNYKL